MRCAVTGGAGFIGSHLTDSLIENGHDVLVIDNLSSGIKLNVNKSASFLKADITSDLSSKLKAHEIDTVFHLAADPDVRASALNPKPSFEINVAGTYSLLESARKADVKSFLITSTSTVYGEAQAIPTPEDYPCIPISNYAASKLANEAYLSSYCASYGLRGTTVRYANIFGQRSKHGVMFDFYNKLIKNPEKMEILGNGKQDKSYLYISDCVSATLTAFEKQKRQYDFFNIGSRRKTSVDQIAKLISKKMGLNPKFSYTGTERGWTGDVKLMLLKTDKIESLGWREKVSFEDGLSKYLDWLSQN
ncbi:MAG: NAD-dependent epimerase/dehydratase family protein [Candidatus Bilamarchaeum sp.]|jgi:UDP-glucose 4-epimerase